MKELFSEMIEPSKEIEQAEVEMAEVVDGIADGGEEMRKMKKIWKVPAYAKASADRWDSRLR